MKSDHRRSDWEDNHLKISEAYFELVKDLKRRPQLKEISHKTKLSIQSVHKHLNELCNLKFEERFKDLKLMSGALLLQMFQHGARGKAACAKLFFQIVEQFSEKIDHSFSGDLYRNMTAEELEKKLEELKIPTRDRPGEPIASDSKKKKGKKETKK